MAEAIGFAILSATTAAEIGAVVGVSAATVASVTGSAVILAGSLAISALTAPDTRQKVAGQQFSVKQPLPSRRRAWGAIKLSGPFVAWDRAGGAMYTAIYLCEGPIGRFREFWLDDVKTALAAGSLVGVSGVKPWDDFVTIEARLGTASQPVVGLLQALSYWSSDYRLDGCAYVAMRAQSPPQKKFSERFPSGTWPSVRAVIEGARVRDVSDPAQTSDPNTWLWSDRAAPVIRDHITHPKWGMGVPDALIDDASFAAFGALCNETITAKDGTAYPRYYLGGTHDLATDPADTLQGMLDACDGRLYLTPAGRIGITGGRYIAPEVTIRQGDVTKVGQIRQGSGKRAAFNRLKISYVSPPHDFQQVEGDPWDDLAAQDEAGEILEADFARPWVQNHNQLRRLAKIHTARQNPRWRITGLVTNRGGLPALFEDTVQVDLPRYGIVGPFEVQRAVASGDGATCVFDLVSIDPTAWTFDPATEEGTAPPLPNVNVEAPLPTPQNLVVLVERRTVNGTTSAVFLRLVAAEPARSDLSLIGRYRRVGDTAWIDMAPEGENRASLVSSVLADGESYEAEGAIATYGRARQSDWTPAGGSPIQAIADTTAPAAPTYSSATLSGATATHAVRQSPSANARSVRLLRALGYGKVLADAAVIDTRNLGPNQELTLSDTIDLGFYQWWLRAANGSGALSDADGPRSLVRLLPADNLLTAPSDFANAAWTKTNTTAASSGTAPDGSPASLLSETTATGVHQVAQTVSGLTSSNRYRASIAVRASGRTRLSFVLADSSGSAFVAMVANLSAGTFTTTSAGSVVTAGACQRAPKSPQLWAFKIPWPAGSVRIGDQPAV